VSGLFLFADGLRLEFSGDLQPPASSKIGNLKPGRQNDGL
jgi:hypothetical protein